MWKVGGIAGRVCNICVMAMSDSEGEAALREQEPFLERLLARWCFKMLAGHEPTHACADTRVPPDTHTHTTQ